MVEHDIKDAELKKVIFNRHSKIKQIYLVKQKKEII